MKIKGAKAVHYDSGPNMTPLVDVVMVILIFLMLVGQFGGAEHFLISNLPIKQSGVGGEAPPPGFIPDEPLEIRVDRRSPMGFTATAGRIGVSDPAVLTAQLTSMRQQMNAAGTPNDKIQVIIGPGKDVQYEHLIRVYESALEAGFTKVAFATSH